MASRISELVTQKAVGSGGNTGSNTRQCCGSGGREPGGHHVSAVDECPVECGAMAGVVGNEVCSQPIDYDKSEQMPRLPATIDGVPQGGGMFCRDIGQAPREWGVRR